MCWNCLKSLSLRTNYYILTTKPSRCTLFKNDAHNIFNLLSYIFDQFLYSATFDMHLCAQENNFGKRKRTKHQNQPGTNQSKNNLNTSIKKMRFIRPKRKARFEKRPRPTFNFDSDSEDGGFEEEDNMGDFIVQDGTPSDATAQKEFNMFIGKEEAESKTLRNL